MTPEEIIREIHRMQSYPGFDRTRWQFGITYNEGVMLDAHFAGLSQTGLAQKEAPQIQEIMGVALTSIPSVGS